MSSEQPSGAPSGTQLRLYVAGDTPGARRALESRRRLVEASEGAFVIEVIDILMHPAEAERAGILATPTLSDDAVAPPRRLIGDIGDVAQVLAYFGHRKRDMTHD